MYRSEYQDIVFYIDSPRYTAYSSGVKTLFALCDKLNRHGIEAYITGSHHNGSLWAPRFEPSMVAAHRAAGKIQVALYPEIEMGNPLLIPNRVRYFLNQPNFFSLNWFGQFAETEYLLHFADEFSLPWLASERLRFLTVDRSLFRLPEGEGEERSGFLVYAYRHTEPDLDQIPEWCHPYTVISMRNPVPPEELAALYRRSRGLILWERSAVQMEALLCGCPIILVPSPLLTEVPKTVRDFGHFGTVWGFDPAGYEFAVETAPLISKLYEAEDLLDERQFRKTLGRIISHFRSIGQGAEDDWSIEMQLGDNAYKAGDFPNAITRFLRVIERCDDNIEAHFKLALALLKCQEPDEALKVLQKGERAVAALPEHRSTSGVRALFAHAQSHIFQMKGDLALATQFQGLLNGYLAPFAGYLKIHDSLRL